MRLLLDTHILLWYFYDKSLLSKKTIDVIDDYSNQIFISVESLREIELKKVTLFKEFKIKTSVQDITEAFKQAGIKIIPVQEKHVFKLHDIQYVTFNGNIHQDPFDRILIATAITDNLTMISSDKKFPEYVKKCKLKLLQNK